MKKNVAAVAAAEIAKRKVVAVAAAAEIAKRKQKKKAVAVVEIAKHRVVAVQKKNKPEVAKIKPHNNKYLKYQILFAHLNNTQLFCENIALMIHGSTPQIT